MLEEVIVGITVVVVLVFFAVWVERFVSGPPWAEGNREYEVHLSGEPLRPLQHLDDIRDAFDSAHDEVQFIRLHSLGKWFEHITVGLSLALAAFGFILLFIWFGDNPGPLNVILFAGCVIVIATVMGWMKRFNNAAPGDWHRRRQCTLRAGMTGLIALFIVALLVLIRIIDQPPPAQLPDVGAAHPVI